MSLARQAFYEALVAMQEVVRDPLLTDSIVGSSQLNTRARILRNGLLVSSFSLLESYLEERLEEKIRELSSSRIGYSSFSEGLRAFLTVHAITGLATKIGFADKADRLQLAEIHLLKAAGFQGAPPSYTGLGFSPRGSNISESDIKELFSSFGVRDGWARLSTLCSSLGSTRLSLRDDFRNLHRARNKAAHDSATNIATADLETYLATSLLIGMTADIVITNSVDCFLRKRTLASAEAAANDLSSLAIRFVDEQVGGAWSERLGQSGSTIKRYPNRESAANAARSRTKAYPIVLRNSALVPTELI